MEVTFCLGLELMLLLSVCMYRAYGTKDIDDYENFKADMRRQMKELSEKVKNFETVNSDLAMKVEQQYSMIEAQNMKIVEQGKELKRLSNQLLWLSGADRDINDTARMEYKTTRKPDTVRRKSKIRRLEPPGDQSVSFFAELSRSISNLSPDHDIHFDHVLTNNGGAYKNFAGTFTAPSTGVYVFLWSITGQRSNLPMLLTVNGVVRQRLETFTGSHDATSTASGFAILNINEGDIVLIKTNPAYQPRGTIRSDQWVTSSFGGWKLH